MSGTHASASFAVRTLRSTAGFTLVELLVVVVVIAILATMATLSMGVLGRDSQSEEQMRRLWGAMNQAREEAELQGLDLGVFVSRTGYEFLRYDGREARWLTIDNDKLFAPRELPEGLRFRLWIESREIVMKPDAVDRSEPGEDKKWQPQIFILSSGDIMPFELQVERDEQPAIWRVASLPDPDLRLERRAGNEPWQIVMQTHPVEDDEKDSRNAAKR